MNMEGHFTQMNLTQFSLFQTNDSMIALLDGEIIDNTDTFVDNLLKDPELKQSRLPLVRDLLCISIAQGNLGFVVLKLKAI
ncbi:hypothetical protein DPMN_157699 [Dreissena polymorpha]|uniref:Uncharacterized protein n=1 Tax=Dreissena polymorpha TaxID=45954 RepID=A0A9D4EJY3_DREPO|nr:hypothetical protein DPMN_157699 [Dreissena polymorpha]